MFFHVSFISSYLFIETADNYLHIINKVTQEQRTINLTKMIEQSERRNKQQERGLYERKKYRSREIVTVKQGAKTYNSDLKVNLQLDEKGAFAKYLKKKEGNHDKSAKIDKANIVAVINKPREGSITNKKGTININADIETYSALKELITKKTRNYHIYSQKYRSPGKWDNYYENNYHENTIELISTTFSYLYNRPIIFQHFLLYMQNNFYPLTIHHENLEIWIIVRMTNLIIKNTKTFQEIKKTFKNIYFNSSLKADIKIVGNSVKIEDKIYKFKSRIVSVSTCKALDGVYYPNKGVNNFDRAKNTDNEIYNGANLIDKLNTNYETAIINRNIPVYLVNLIPINSTVNMITGNFNLNMFILFVALLVYTFIINKKVLTHVISSRYILMDVDGKRFIAKSFDFGDVRFKNEIAVLNKLKHDNISNTIVQCVYKNIRAIIYKDIPSQNSILLAEMLNKIDESMFFSKFYSELTGVLLFLRKRRVCHNNLSPDNIYFSDGKFILAGWEDAFDINLYYKGQKRTRSKNIEDLDFKIIGTKNFRSPEIILHNLKIGVIEFRKFLKSDVFCFGILLYMVKFGYHPFDIPVDISLRDSKIGDPNPSESKNLKHLNSFSFLTQIEKNILNNNYSLKIKKCYCFFDMIHKMLKPYPLDRIDIVGVKKHPFNWNAGKIFQFFAIISDYLEGRHKSSKQLFLRLEINKNKIFTKRWCDYIHPEIVADMEGRKDKNYSNFKEDMNDNRLKEQKNDFISSESKIMTTENYGHVKSYKPYNFKTVKGLLRAIRNKGTHYQELDASISRIYGGFPKGFINYYLQRFPGLVMVVYYSAKCAAGEDIICEFY